MMSDTMKTMEQSLLDMQRCDRCGARKVVRALLPGGGELLFCGHHYNDSAAALTAAGAVIEDDRDLKPVST